MQLRKHKAGLVFAASILAALASPAASETVQRGNCADQNQAEGTSSNSSYSSSRSGDGSLSTTITAGNGQVSGGTTFGGLPGVAAGQPSSRVTTSQNGKSVTVTSSGRNGSSTSSASSSSGTNGTAAASGSGDCVIISD